jgi:hypothetical protein
VVVGDSALPIVLPHPTIEPQMTATASAVVGWRMFLSVPAVPNRSSLRDIPIARSVKKWCSNAADVCLRLTVFLDNDERCFLITIGGSSTAPSGVRSVRRVGEARGNPPSVMRQMGPWVGWR